MELIKQIAPLDSCAMEAALKKWNGIAKPLGSLGLLEKAIIQIAGIKKSADFTIKKRCVVVMCADNGVVSEGVTQSGSDVTGIVAHAIADGTSNVNLIAKQFNADVFPVDIGMNETVDSLGLINRKIRRGTCNIADGAAMSVADAEKAISVGIEAVKKLSEKGYDIIVTGEMGIGNTTTSSAIASVILEMTPESVTGRGAGLSSEGLERKIKVIRRAIDINKPQKDKPVELLAKLGGFDIAGIAGVFIGGAIYGIPVIIDGFISAVAASIAAGICPAAKDYMLCSHVSKEPAGIKILNHLGMKPMITAELCLGEGTGGLFILPMLDGALAVYNSSHTFNNLPMERYVELK